MPRIALSGDSAAAAMAPADVKPAGLGSGVARGGKGGSTGASEAPLEGPPMAGEGDESGRPYAIAQKLPPGTKIDHGPGDHFIACVPAGPGGAILVYLKEQDRQQYIRWRYWYYSALANRWVPDRSLQFIMPAEHAMGLVHAITAAVNNEALTRMPDWLEALRGMKGSNQPITSDGTGMGDSPVLATSSSKQLAAAHPHR